jgi:bacterioferritin (cytochrome b1)
MAEEARLSANLLRDKILSTGKRIEEISGDVKSGKNHWERMVQDLSDEREIETRFLERAALMDEAAPEAAGLLRQIAASHRPHIDALLDLIVRADPQAEQT